MAKWKKIIVSGSDALLQTVTSSHGLKLQIAEHPTSGGLKGNAVTTPLVIDSEGNVHTGSAYALASGGNTVGGSNLTSNVALVGNSNSLIKSASNAAAVNFNSADLENANKLIVGQITASNLLFSSSGVGINATSSISVTPSQSLNIFATEISSSKITATTASIDQIDFIRTSFISSSQDIIFNSSSKVHQIKTIDGGTLFITASGYAISSSVANGIVTASNLASLSSQNLILGDTEFKTFLTGSTIVLGAGGGITASNVPQVDNFPFFLGVSSSGEVTKVNKDDLNLSTSTTTIDGVLAGDNLNISSNISSTSNIETLIAEKFVIVGGTNQIFRNDQNGDSFIDLSVSDTIVIKAYSSAVGRIVSQSFTILEKAGPGTYTGPGSGNGSSYSAHQSMSLSATWDQGFSIVDGGELYLVTSNGNTGVVTINLNDSINITGSITASGGIITGGDLIFDDSLATTHSIEFGTNSTLNISASNINVANNIDVGGNVDADTFSLNGINFTVSEITSISGSTAFGTVASGSDPGGTGTSFFPSQITHQFTGSVLITGSGITLVGGQFAGDGGGITNLNAANIAGNINAGGGNLLTGSGLFSQSAQVDGTQIQNNTISGITLGSSLNNLSVDDTTLELESGTTYNGGSGRTISAKTASVGTGVTALATGDQINTAINNAVSSLTGNDGTVTSVATTGNVNGITLTGGPITTTGTITLGGTLSVGDSDFSGQLSISKGGTNASTAADAATNLGLGTGDTPTFTGLTLSTDALTINGTLVTSTATELNLLDGATANTVVNNKAVIYGSSGELAGTLSTAAQTNITSVGTLTSLQVANALSSNTLSVAGNAVINGDLTVNGSTTTINTTNLDIEDRFITLGSGSSVTDSNLDIGIIFDSGISNDIGLALYYNASRDRLTLARNVNDASMIGTTNISSTDAVNQGNVVTVKSISVAGSNLSTDIGTGDNSASFGEGEMVIDSNNDIWVYTT